MQPQSDLRLIRKLDTTFVNNLKKRIQEDPTGPGVPPIAALCVNVDKENFAERYKDSYRYEVLGGQHTVAAKAELLRENPSNSLYNQVFAEVYIDLSEKESLRLASRHNNNGHFIHRMSHKDYVSFYLILYIYGRGMYMYQGQWSRPKSGGNFGNDCLSHTRFMHAILGIWGILPGEFSGFISSELAF